MFDCSVATTRRWSITLVVIMLFLAGEGAARAASRPAPDVRELAQGSELVFVGKVVEIRYAMSKPVDEAEGGVPHTFVTYEVGKVLRGAIDAESARRASGREGRTVTLRFAGGLRRSDGAVLRVSTVPRFDLGDMDVLFVRANGIANCPLAQWQNGRMRVIDGRLHSEEGHELVPVAKGRLGWGAKHDFPEVMSHTVGEKVYEVRRDRPDKGGEETDGPVPPKPGKAVALEAFVERFSEMAGDGPRGLQPVKSADPKEPFAGPAAVPAKPAMAVNPSSPKTEPEEEGQ